MKNFTLALGIIALFSFIPNHTQALLDSRPIARLGSWNCHAEPADGWTDSLGDKLKKRACEKYQALKAGTIKQPSLRAPKKYSTKLNKKPTNVSPKQTNKNDVIKQLNELLREMEILKAKFKRLLTQLDDEA